MNIAAPGGADNPGPGLARRRAAASHAVIIGSCTADTVDQVQAAAAEILSALGTCGA